MKEDIAKRLPESGHFLIDPRVLADTKMSHLIDEIMAQFIPGRRDRIETAAQKYGCDPDAIDVFYEHQEAAGSICGARIAERMYPNWARDAWLKAGDEIRLSRDGEAERAEE